MRVTRPKRRYHRRIHDAVNVGLFQRRVARVELGSNDFHSQDADVPGDVSVDRCAQLVRRYLAFQCETGDLSFGVYARVGPASFANAAARCSRWALMARRLSASNGIGPM